MLLSNLPSVSLFPSTSNSDITPFWHSVPQQPLQPALHLSLLECQEYSFLLHGFFEGT